MNVARTHLLLLALAFAAFATGIFIAPQPIRSQTAGPLTGYAWSDTIGWIDLNCANTDSCGSIPFGLTADADGTLSGYAWGDNIGWISANPSDLSGCPSSPCSARLAPTGFSGWLRALSGGTDQSGGWDGFISLSGPNYGVRPNPGGLSGFAWGDIVVGWVDFAFTLNQCTPIYTCVGNAIHNSCSGEETPCLPGYVCSGGACIGDLPQEPSGSIQVSPSLVRSGDTTRVTWTASTVTTCTVTEDNPAISDAWEGLDGSETSSPIADQTTYTLACEGDAGSFTRSATVNLLPVFQEE